MKKLDEPHEEAGNELLEIPRNHDIKVDHSQRIKCPRCVEMIMMRHFYSVKREAEVDECPKCRGYWLDYGELGQIRSQFPTEEARYEAAQKYFDDLFGKQFSHLRLEGEEKVEKVERIMKILKYLCPSYYIPGKQKWGSF